MPDGLDAVRWVNESRYRGSTVEAADPKDNDTGHWNWEMDYEGTSCLRRQLDWDDNYYLWGRGTLRGNDEDQP